MLVPFEIEPTSLRAGENELVIHITPAMIAALALSRRLQHIGDEVQRRLSTSARRFTVRLGHHARACLCRYLASGCAELRPLDRIDDVFIAVDSYNVEKPRRIFPSTATFRFPGTTSPATA